MAEETQSRLLTTQDAARVLNVSAKKVRRLIVGGDLEAENVTVGGDRPTYRIDPKKLAEFRRKRQTVPETTTRRRARLASTSSQVIEFV